MKVVLESEEEAATCPTPPPLEVVARVLDEIPKAKHFKAKWSLITSKLDQLHSQLPDLTETKNNGSLLSSELLESMFHTVDRALALVYTCQAPVLEHGKLRTQSDLDSVLATLDRHVHDAHVLLYTGAPPLLPQGCLHDSKRGSSSTELKNLITRLQIGTMDSRNSALDSLLGLLRQDDDENVVVSVSQGLVPVLVSLLDTSTVPEIKEKAVAAIARVSVLEAGKHALLSQSQSLLLLNHLIRILESGTGFGKENACIALQALTFSSKENARALCSRGGVSCLLDICVDGTPASQALAAGVLRNLAAFPETKPHFLEEDAAQLLLGLAASGTPLAQENAIGCLCNLLPDDNDGNDLKLLVVREKGIECLKNYWDDSARTERSLEVAVELLGRLASCQPIGEALVAEGFILRVSSALTCGVTRVRIAAAQAVCELGFSSKTKKELGECGCVEVLIRMLEAKAVEEREVAAKALLNLMVYNANRRIFRKDGRGIINVVQLLDLSLANLDKKYPVSILSSVAHSNKCRRQMVDAGACAYLLKLMDIEGAKKLYETIRRGKIWDVFSRS